MPRLSYELIEHRLHISKKGISRTSSQQEGSTQLTRYVNWLSNIVPIIRKNGQVRICIYFRNLNLAMPKDKYVMPIANMLIDAADNNGILTFMDRYLGYNQIYLAEEDIHKIAFRCLGSIGIFEWVVMPFELKNVGIIYQKAMNLIFHDLIGKKCILMIW